MVHRVPFPPPGNLPNPGIEPTPTMSPALQTDSLLLEPSGEALNRLECGIYITFICAGKPKQFMCLTLLQCSLYCSDLESILQYL